MPMTAAGGSIQGARLENEDAFVILEGGFGVFDGVGGRPNGAAAARTAAAALAEALLEAEPLQLLDARVRATSGATTAAVVRLGKTSTVWTVGDSPVFHLAKTIKRLTPPDGLGRYITRCLGHDATGHRATVVVGPDEVLVACSDGVTNVLGPDEIADLVRGVEPQEAVRRILARVAAAGAADNATVVVCRG